MNSSNIEQLLLQQRVEQFIYSEAALIDSRDFDGWLELFTEDALYWVPSNDPDMDPNLHVSIIYDTLEELKDRIWRLGTGAAYAQEPTSHTLHQYTNLRIEGSPDDDEITVDGTLVIHDYRHNHHLRSMDTVVQYPARCEYRLRQTEGLLRIVLRKIDLLAANGVLGNMGFII